MASKLSLSTGSIPRRACLPSRAGAPLRQVYLLNFFRLLQPRFRFRTTRLIQVMTWTLCSIPDPLAALREMRRVLKPDGNLYFVEHGLSPEPSVERWQHRITPAWRRMAGGCHLDRKMDDLIRQAGFDLTNLHEEYAPGPRAMSYMYQGCACRDHSRGIGPAD